MIDLNGDDVAESPAALSAAGITNDELTNLAARYTAGTTLWRVPITHFTAWDFNWPFGPPDCEGNVCPEPPPGPKLDEDPPCGTSTQPGSIIECEPQGVGESVQVPGTPFSLNYRSTRMPGYAQNRQIVVDLTGPSVHSRELFVELTVDVAGQRYHETFTPSPNLRTVFTWDGRDGFGRPVLGAQRARVEAAAWFQGEYLPGSTFGNFSPDPNQAIGGDRALSRVPFFNEQRIELGSSAPSGGWLLGGWTLSEHHFYDPVTSKLYSGTGSIRRAGPELDVVELVGGNGTTTPGADGTLARTGGFRAPSVFLDDLSIAAAPNGDVYVAIRPEARIRRIDREGKIWTVAGILDQEPCPAALGDGGPATSARLKEPRDLVAGPDGSLYFSDLSHRIRRVRPDVSSRRSPAARRASARAIKEVSGAMMVPLSKLY